MGILIPSIVNSCRIGFSDESRQMVQTCPSAMMAGWLMRFRPKLIVECCGLSTCPAKDPNALAAWERDPSAPSCGPSPLWVIGYRSFRRQCHPMSAMLPIATKALRRRDWSRWAKKRLMHCTNFEKNAGTHLHDTHLA